MVENFKPADKNGEEKKKRLKFSYIPEYEGAKGEWLHEIAEEAEEVEDIVAPTDQLNAAYQTDPVDFFDTETKEFKLRQNIKTKIAAQRNVGAILDFNSLSFADLAEYFLKETKIPLKTKTIRKKIIKTGITVETKSLIADLNHNKKKFERDIKKRWILVNFDYDPELNVKSVADSISEFLNSKNNHLKNFLKRSARMQQLSNKTDPKKNGTQGVMLMTFRDFVAVAAMNGLLAKSHPDELISVQKTCTEAYRYADCMIKVSNQ